MKPTAFLLVAVLFCNCARPKHELPDYVEFSIKTAIITHPLPNPLIISTKKVDFHLDKYELADLKSLIENRYTGVMNPVHWIYRNAKFLKRRNGLSKTDTNANKITEQDKEDYTNFKYARRLTDKKTFTEIVNFIYDNKNNYPGGESLGGSFIQGFEIDMGKNMKFWINRKAKGSFLINLRAYLSIKQCDQKIIDELGVI